ncbi:hypothetical protein [Meiothermus taiwanensis]|jgi:hypothetical protein|uniref:Uncharacterized protein n=2 Tax=Meiothermus taiwanensis TaxID=172827 RepID=A0A399E7N1_9DEIN|nr:hypothetical protein [Meiothermus taiwanensis]AWR87098.1 hypothetical protein Mtai_v1c18640 [Meiothermus taiwanensis WR-220]KIQ53455.1 hypothetical protein SY28_13790 [Meiothermus taiwanensis]KZK16650.1 hypothetical protein A3962_14545 [Meiothermus taiwanensis]RIH79169.1 hypothetical protein Mcate_00520 [Meiothermus taiwanensis]
MGFKCSLNIVVSESSFLDRVSLLKPYELLLDDESMDSLRKADPTFPFVHDRSYYVNPTPISDFPKRFAQLRPLADNLAIRSQYDIEETLLKTNLYRGHPSEGILTLSFSPWAQHPPLLEHGYLLLDLAYPSEKNQSFLPWDHPSLEFIWEIMRILNPTYGWLEGDWNPHPPEVDWLGRPWYIPSILPWQEGGERPQLVGPPLSEAVKAEFDLGDANNGLYMVKEIAERLYWIAQPGTVAEWEKYRWEMWHELYKDTEVGKAHEAAIWRLREALARIPTSVLDKQR